MYDVEGGWELCCGSSAWHMQVCEWTEIVWRRSPQCLIPISGPFQHSQTCSLPKINLSNRGASRFRPRGRRFDSRNRHHAAGSRQLLYPRKKLQMAYSDTELLY